MLKTRVLVILFLIQPNWIKWVSMTLVSDVNLCLSPLNWLGWMKLFKIEWNWSQLLMTFLISFPMVLNRTMGLKDLEESYDSLLSLGMTMNIEVLKCKDQWPNSKHILAMLIIFFRHNLFLMILLRCLYDNLSKPGVNELLHLAIELINSSSKNETHFINYLFEILSNMLMSTCQS